MNDQVITTETAHKALWLALESLEPKKQYVVTIKEFDCGKWTLARLWRAWMTQAAEWMTWRGVTMPLCVTADGKPYGKRPFNADDAHELFTYKFLGADKDGNRLSWSRAGHDGMRPATKGERFHALQMFEAWASEKGLNLTQPADSEYRKLNPDMTKD